MREYSTVDKADWGPGPWQQEPDKKQWVDPGTGLDCLIVRNHGGALCGYVGVPESHPWFGKGYSECLIACDEAAAGWCYKHSPDGSTQVHGGLTYSDLCQDAMTFAEWAEKTGDGRWQDWVEEKGLPRGHTYQEYVDWNEANAICHIPEPGRPAKVWWFGFDCTHGNDACPGFAAVGRQIGLSSSSFDESDGPFGRSYKTVSYVEKEVASLARQLYEASPDTVALDHLDL